VFYSYSIPGGLSTPLSNAEGGGKDEEKINRRVRRDRRDFTWYRQKQKLFYEYGLLFAFRSSGIEDQRMNEEEAEIAEIVP
jgi:hypothetical protein